MDVSVCWNVPRVLTPISKKAALLKSILVLLFSKKLSSRHSTPMVSGFMIEIELSTNPSLSTASECQSSMSETGALA
jgi:hypothetical protein